MKNNQKKQKNSAIAVFLLTIFMMTILPACSRTAAQPEIKIRPQAQPTAGDVTISVDVSNFSLGDGTPAGSGSGRIIYYLDTSVPTYYAHSAVSKAGTFFVSGDTSYTWSGVTPGEHTFAVQLVDNKNSPLPLPVIDTVTVTVSAPEGQPTVSIINPEDGSAVSPGNISVSVSIGNFIVSRADMGVVNRTGEGHFIYYLDEMPPTDAGVPATTDTSIVSTDLNHLWKYLKEGTHTFSVQLVNNDDTPLDTPVVATVSVDISA